MYKVLVVHHDKVEMDRICKAVLSTKHDAELIRVTSSKEILETIEEKKPDIVFLAIEMMGTLWIDIAEKIKKLDFSVHIIFTSMYDDFELTRKALKIGVDDYLLEPIKDDDLEELVEKLFSTIDAEREESKKKKEKEKLIEDVYGLTGYSFVYSVLFNGKMTKDIEHYRKILDLSDMGFWLNVEADNKNCSIGSEKIDIHESVRKILKGNCKYIIGPRLLNRIAVYVSVDMNKSEDEQRIKSIEIAKKLVYGLEQEYNIKVYVGIGSLQTIDKLQISYEEALKCLRGDVQKQIVHIQDITSNNTISVEHKVYMEYEKKLLESIELGKDGVTESFSLLLNYLSKMSIIDKRNKILEILVLACYAVNKLGVSECNYVDYSKFYEEFTETDDVSIDAWALNKFQFILKSARKNKIDNMSETVKNAIYYIHEHYNESISLNDIASVVGVSLQYFSKIFKDETGSNYVEWVNNLRINKAKELMNTTQLTIKEVCFRVGYNDPNYFSRIFKRYEGIAPTEFINKKE